MITKEAIEAACAVLNKRDRGNAISIPDVVAMLTAALAAMPAQAVRVEYANRSTGGFAPAHDLASENERLRAALEWYGEQAAATFRLKAIPDALMAIVVALSLDGGKRAKAALERT